MRHQKYHDNLYASFTTIDSVRNEECGRNFHSGWWFPYGMSYVSNHGVHVIEYCTYEDMYGTNLNGVYHPNVSENQFQIGFCRKNVINDCVKPKFNEIADIIGWQYSNIDRIKLKQADMWLGRKYN